MLKFLGRDGTLSDLIFHPVSTRRRLVYVGTFVISLAIATVAPIAYAQTVTFGGVRSTVSTSTLSNPDGAAVDSSGNVYIANAGSGTVLKETLGSDGTFTETTIVSGLSGPQQLAVDSSGNLYIADTNNNRAVKETLSGGSYTQSTIGTGLTTPDGIAVDSNGNVYITDAGNSRVLKETASSGSYSQTQIITGTFQGIAVDGSGNLYLTNTNGVVKETYSGGTYSQSTIASGIGGAFGIAVDSNGILYVADTDTASAGRVLEEIPSSASYSQVTIYSGATGPAGIAVDWQGNLYVANTDTNQLQRIVTAGANFGNHAVGAASASISLAFTFTSGGTIGAPAVLTQGATGLDFSDAGTGTCTTNGATHAYSAGDSCTVDVIFTPKIPGVRYGAAVLKDSSGSVIATGYAQGVGLGPQVSFTAATTKSLSLSNLPSPYPITADTAGNLYIANAVVAYDPSNALMKETWNGSGYTQSTVATGLGWPTGLAVDGAGNIYIADQDNYTVYKETPSNGGYVQSVVDSTLGTVGGIAVDGAGNVYVGRGGIGVEKETLVGGSYSRSEIFYTFYATAIAVDAQGNLYLGDGSTSGIRKEVPTSGGYVESRIASGHFVSKLVVDGIGDLYFTDNQTITKASPSGGTYVLSTVGNLSVVGSSSIAGLALEPSGNVWYTAFNYTSRLGTVTKLDFADSPSLSFATTAVGTTSTDSPQVVSIQNMGNAPLSFPVPTSGTNPSTSSSFTLNSDETSACPQVKSGSSTAGTLAAGASCDLSINFVPIHGGTSNGTVILTDDSLNLTTPSYATQSIQVSGIGTQVSPVLSWSTPTAITFGTVLSGTQLNATATYGGSAVAGTFAYTPAAGTVLGVGADQTLSVTFTPTDASGYTSATGSVKLTVNQAAPANTLSSSSATAFTGTSVTFTAMVSSAAGSPTGTVTFWDGQAQLGTATLSGGGAAYTTSSLGLGAHSITAAYSGDANFAPVTSAVLTQTIASMTIGAGSGGSTTASAAPGGQASYTLAFAPSSGTSFPNAIQLSVSGLPPGATATFDRNPIPAGSGATNVTLTVNLAAKSALNDRGGSSDKGGFPIELALLVLPVVRRFKRVRHHLWSTRSVFLGAVAVSVVLMGLGGCGGSTPSANPQTYTLTVTATSGSFSQNTALTLTVQ